MWCSLQISPQDLSCEVTLFCGQTFRWHQVGEAHWRGVVGDCVVELRQEDERLLYRIPAGNASTYLLHDYFQLWVPLPQLYLRWSQRDERFAQVSSYLPGVRVIRSDPVECLFSFLCSSANNIARITRMVRALCERYGDLIAEMDGIAYHRFPPVHRIAAAAEEELYAMGFGYRARTIVRVARELCVRGEEWLYGLRQLCYAEAHAELITLPGVGHKIADCVCLFSLDKPQAIPVDTHVWQIAQRDYLPELQGRSLTERAYWRVGDFFRERFGEYAGWAHNVLFAAELPLFQRRMAR